MSDYWTTAVTRFEHDERIRRARWDGWANSILRQRRAERRVLRAARKKARKQAIGRAATARSAQSSPRGA